MARTNIRFETHSHTHNSSDSDASVYEMCKAAANMGLSSIAFTDHYDLTESDIARDGRPDDYKLRGYDEIIRYREEFKDILKVHIGAEIGGIVYYPEFTKRMLESNDFDVVIGSLHGFKDEPQFYETDFTAIDHNKKLEEYFKVLYEQSKLELYDILAHLDYPVRYVVSSGLKADFSLYGDYIDEILRSVAQNGKALEINTSRLNKQLFRTQPDTDIIKRFNELGGEFITIGSDAHTPQNIASGFDAAVDIAYRAGFKYITYYEKRTPKTVKIY